MQDLCVSSPFNFPPPHHNFALLFHFYFSNGDNFGKRELFSEQSYTVMVARTHGNSPVVRSSDRKLFILITSFAFQELKKSVFLNKTPLTCVSSHWRHLTISVSCYFCFHCAVEKFQMKLLNFYEQCRRNGSRGNLRLHH